VIPFDIAGTVHISGRVRSNSATVKAAANRLAAMLDEKDCTEVFIEGNRVRFTNAWFGGTLRWGLSDYRSSLFTSFGSGTFDIEAALDGLSVTFSLSLVRTWILVGLLAAVFFGVPAPKHTLYWHEVWSYPVAFLVGIAVVNYVVTWLRVRYWLRKGLEGVSEASMKL
jgi:hypothetical protein